MDTLVSNFTYDELQIGQTASLSRTVSEDDIKLFAASSHDTNPAHLDADYAATTMFKKVVIHGMWTAGLISTVLGTKLPGLGSIYLGQDLKFLRPVYVGDTVTVTVTVSDKNDAKKWVTLDCVVVNQNGDKVVTGQANILAPKRKLNHPAIPVPQVKFM